MPIRKRKNGQQRLYEYFKQEKIKGAKLQQKEGKYKRPYKNSRPFKNRGIENGR